MIYQFGEFEIDTRDFVLRKQGAVVEIEPKVFDLLCYLVKNRDRLVTRDELFETLWQGQVVSDTSLSNQVKAARRAIGDDGQQQSKIKTIRGRGYRFLEPTQELAPETQARTTLEQAAAKAAANDSNAEPSIAVLPFVNMSGDPGQDFFSDGITEDIITELSRFRSLIVVARNSSFMFRDSAQDLREVSKKLGARFILEGSVRKAGDRVRITAQLINGVTGEHVWADRYDGEITDVFAVQDEITASIVATIAGRIGDYELNLIRSQPTENLSAYESVLRAQHLMHNYTEVDYRKAQEHVEHAIALDPDFARAHALKAYLEFSLWVVENDPQRLESSLALGKAALAHDDHESRSHLAVGAAQLFNREYEKAEHHLSRALTLNPNDDLIMIENGRFLMYTNRPSEGAAIVQQAMRHNPYHPNWYWNILGRCFHTAKHYEEAISALERVSNPPYWTLSYLAACHAEHGNEKKAETLRAATMAARPDFTISNMARALPYRDEEVLNQLLDGYRKAGFPA